jgi:two-component system phosphate regulon sensor histidine kinase PhoR
MMRQAVFNLVSNALKYTPQGGTVTVRLRVDEGQREVTTEIIDSGVGIDAGSLPHIFDKFYRVAGSKKMAKGTGLGLALVKEIVETIHDGRLSAKSSPGQGSTFAFSLPLED